MSDEELFEILKLVYFDDEYGVCWKDFEGVIHCWTI